MPISPNSLRMAWNLARHMGLPWATDAARAHLLAWCQSGRLPGYQGWPRDPAQPPVTTEAWYVALHGARETSSSALPITAHGQVYGANSQVRWVATADPSFDPSYVFLSVYDATGTVCGEAYVAESAEGNLTVTFNRTLPTDSSHLETLVRLAGIACESPERVLLALRLYRDQLEPGFPGHAFYTRAVEVLQPTPASDLGGSPTESSMKIVTLRTGHRVSEALVNAVMKSLHFLTDTHKDMDKGANLGDVLSFYEAVAKARDASYKVPFERRVKLEVYHLLDGDGRMHESVALVIRAAVVGDGTEMTIQDPLKEPSEVPQPPSTHEAPDMASEESDLGTEPDPHRA